MRLYYGKTIAVALATFLMAGTTSVQASSRFYDIQFNISDDNKSESNFEGLKKLLQNPDSTTIKNHTHTLCKLWDDKKNGKYNNQYTFMDILMESINFNGRSLTTTNLQEKSQFRAILTGMCQSANLQEGHPIRRSIDTLDDKAASLWFKAMIASRSKDQTFFSSYFNLTRLNLSNNNLTDVDVSQNSTLTDLNLSGNKLRSVDVSQNSTLKSLDLSKNYLTNVDLSKNTVLKSLYLFNNNLTSVDVSKNTSLINLLISNNKLTSIDLSQNTALINLYLFNNYLNSIDLSKNTALIELHLSYNSLTSVDVSQNTALRTLVLSKNPSLKKEDVNGVTSDMQVIWEEF